MGIFDSIYDSVPSDSPVEGVDYVMSPQGYRIMTEYYLVKRGYCCSNGCQNCPYLPRAVKGNRKLRPEVEGKYNS